MQVGCRWVSPLTLFKSIPEDVPELVKPNYDAIEIGKLQSMVRKCVEVLFL
jgi:hypothetical protein